MIERILITPDLLRIKNESGNIIFDTNNRYLKTDASGDLMLTQSGTAPFPISHITLNYRMGALINLFQNLSSSSLFSFEYTPSVSGYLAFYPIVGLGGGGVRRTDSEDTYEDFVSVNLGSSKIWSRKLNFIFYFLPHNMQLSGILTSLTKNTHTIGNDDAIYVTAGSTYRIYKDANQLTTSRGSRNYSGFNLAVHFFSAPNNLPLKVTI